MIVEIRRIWRRVCWSVELAWVPHRGLNQGHLG